MPETVEGELVDNQPVFPQQVFFDAVDELATRLPEPDADLVRKLAFYTANMANLAADLFRYLRVAEPATATGPNPES